MTTVTATKHILKKKTISIVYLAILTLEHFTLFNPVSFFVDPLEHACSVPSSNFRYFLFI